MTPPSGGVSSPVSPWLVLSVRACWEHGWRRPGPLSGAFFDGENCRWLLWHRSMATPVASLVLLFVVTALIAGGWSRRQWPFLLSLSLLVSAQVALGVLTMRLGLSQPGVTVAHQLVAALLVALLAALVARRPQTSTSLFPSSSTTPHGALSWLVRSLFLPRLPVRRWFHHAREVKLPPWLEVAKPRLIPPVARHNAGGWR